MLKEVFEDGTVLCGVEIELRQLELVRPRQPYFFWAASQGNPIVAYEEAVSQAVSFLQTRFGFVVTDYTSNGLMFFRKFSCLLDSSGAADLQPLSTLYTCSQKKRYPIDIVPHQVLLICLADGASHSLNLVTSCYDCS